MIVKDLSVTDAGTLAKIHASAFDEAWDTDAFIRLLQRTGAFAIGAQRADATDLQSFILAEVAADQAEILTLATIPSARRLGLGCALVRAAQKRASQCGALAMFLEVAEDNEAAVALYSGCGFAINGRRRAYYRRGAAAMDALILMAPLAKESWE